MLPWTEPHLPVLHVTYCRVHTWRRALSSWGLCPNGLCVYEQLSAAITGNEFYFAVCCLFSLQGSHLAPGREVVGSLLDAADLAYAAYKVNPQSACAVSNLRVRRVVSMPLQQDPHHTQNRAVCCAPAFLQSQSCFLSPLHLFLLLTAAQPAQVGPHKSRLQLSL
jgi:hypothetical protein